MALRFLAVQPPRVAVVPAVVRRVVKLVKGLAAERALGLGGVLRLVELRLRLNLRLLWGVGKGGEGGGGDLCKECRGMGYQKGAASGQQQGWGRWWRSWRCGCMAPPTASIPPCRSPHAASPPTSSWKKAGAASLAASVPVIQWSTLTYHCLLAALPSRWRCLRRKARSRKARRLAAVTRLSCAITPGWNSCGGEGGRGGGGQRMLEVMQCLCKKPEGGRAQPLTAAGGRRRRGAVNAVCGHRRGRLLAY